MKATEPEGEAGGAPGRNWDSCSRAEVVWTIFVDLRVITFDVVVVIVQLLYWYEIN